MNEIPDNFGPWMNEQPLVGFCVCCYGEKTEHEIKYEYNTDDLNSLDKNDLEELRKIKERNIKNLPTIICCACMGPEGDEDFFGDSIDEIWKDSNDE